MSDMMLLSVNQPTARKRHICQWCREPIHPGEQYIRYNCIYDGFQSTKMHSECYESSARYVADEQDDLLPTVAMARGGVFEKAEGEVDDDKT